jgi:microcystin-dependent protein
MSYLIQFRNDTAANWATANTILAAGEAGFDVTNQILKVGTGVTPWSSLQGISLATGGGAPGIISQFAGATAPPGYLLCDGAAVSRTTFSSLFTTIGTAYGTGNGTTTFNLPNLQNRIPVGKGPDAEFDTLGETGGEKAVTLTSSQIPAHSHPNTLSSNTVASSGHVHDHINPIGLNSGQPVVLGGNVAAMSNMGRGFSAFAGSIQGSSSVNLLGNQTQNFEVWRIESSVNSANTTVGISNANNTGGGSSHTNLQPYIVVNYIIKT